MDQKQYFKISSPNSVKLPKYPSVLKSVKLFRTYCYTCAIFYSSQCILLLFIILKNIMVQPSHINYYILFINYYLRLCKYISWNNFSKNLFLPFLKKKNSHGYLTSTYLLSRPLNLIVRLILRMQSYECMIKHATRSTESLSCVVQTAFLIS